MPERRCGVLRSETEIALAAGKEKLRAKTTDFSRNGAGIILKGRRIEADALVETGFAVLKKMALTEQVPRPVLPAGLKFL